ncbi:MAG: response regulator, partial [Anaerolineae bacterium]|nr:response regulator [Anaerolineae bacterium]
LPPTPYSLLHFSVRDTGIGIPADKLDRLFQSFTQLDASTTRHYGGTGLGLAISQRLAELMGGTMWAESKGAGQGTIFHFTLTAQAAPVPARHHLSHPRPELSGKRVLIVDDNATNRRILNLQLQNWGLLAQEAATPAEALEAIRRGDAFDLALLDMNMPEMDGATLATEICYWHSPDHFPLVMLTSLGYQTHPELEALECFAAYLTKPVKPSQLYDTLVNVFAEEEANDQLAPSQSQLPVTNLHSPISHLRILLAEDVQVNQKFALLALEEIGYRADVAANGLEVLAAVLRQPYDVILMDVQMPEMDGLEATQRIHDIWANQALRGFNNLNGASDDGLPTTNRPYIIAMTANALQGDREICLAAGMDDYISKPVYLEELRLVLKRAGRRRSAAEPNHLDGVSLPEPASTPAVSSQNSNEHIDQAVLDKLLIRPSGRKLVAGYLSEAADMVSALRNAVAENDTQVVREVAHNLKGSSSYVGVTGVAGLSSELEQQGRRGLINDAATTVAQLVEAFDQTRQLLHERLDASTAFEGVRSQK